MNFTFIFYGALNSFHSPKSNQCARWIWSSGKTMFWESKSAAVARGTTRTQELLKEGPKPQLCREGLGHTYPFCNYNTLRFISYIWLAWENSEWWNSKRAGLVAKGPSSKGFCAIYNRPHRGGVNEIIDHELVTSYVDCTFRLSLFWQRCLSKAPSLPH